MKKEVFFEELAECLEIEDVQFSESTILKELDDYDSMAVMSLIAFVDEKFNLELSAEKINGITNLESLMSLIGKEKFN